MQHLLPAFRNRDVDANLRREIIEPTISLLFVGSMTTEAIMRKERIGFELSDVRCRQGCGTK